MTDSRRRNRGEDHTCDVVALRQVLRAMMAVAMGAYTVMISVALIGRSLILLAGMRRNEAGSVHLGLARRGIQCPAKHYAYQQQ